jgi:hypothetical protein
MALISVKDDEDRALAARAPGSGIRERGRLLYRPLDVHGSRDRPALPHALQAFAAGSEYCRSCTANHPDGGAVFTVILPVKVNLPAAMTPEAELAAL